MVLHLLEGLFKNNSLHHLIEACLYLLIKVLSLDKIKKKSMSNAKVVKHHHKKEEKKKGGGKNG